MIDTNQLQQLAQAAPVAPQTWNAWHVVALGSGVAIAHVYHTVVNAGGIKKLWSNFWNGPAEKTPGEGTLPTKINPTIK